MQGLEQIVEHVRCTVVSWNSSVVLNGYSFKECRLAEENNSRTHHESE